MWRSTRLGRAMLVVASVAMAFGIDGVRPAAAQAFRVRYRPARTSHIGDARHRSAPRAPSTSAVGRSTPACGPPARHRSRPAVFLLDEPLSNLDAHLRVQMRAEILNVHRAVNATAVYVTHDQVEALMMGDRIVVMNAGRIHQVGTPDELYDLPVDRFVASGR